ncbi:MAG: P-loop containing nucleoside triphosphate hydrolase protein [Benjaminiella poitrasii]|nr:MAG: P-loop containing nucleoside triphosphate hydrolase protein [Benjaminiella poitrasii]
MESRVDEKKGKKAKEPSVTIFQLFRFASMSEQFLILIAILCSACTGALQPVSILIYGSFISNLTKTITDTSKMLDVTLPIIHTMLYMGTAALVAAYISTCLWIITGERQSRRIRLLYLKSVLHQDMAWFDSSTEGSLNTRLASDTQIIQDGISEKFDLFISFFAQFVGGFVVAFVKGWQMALILLIAVPLLGASGSLMTFFLTKYTKEAQDSFAESGSIAEQAFQSIKTVYTYNLQNRFCLNYNQKLESACRFGVKGGIALGIGFAFFMFFLFGTFGLALWFGSRLVVQGHLTGPSVFIVFLSMMLGCMSFVKLPPNLSAISNARGAAYKIFSTIDRVPVINADSSDGKTLQTMKGEIEFKNVYFNYPSRPDTVILKNLSFKVRPGMTVAFVGASGSGKSTTVQLVQRFYDVVSGQILFDGYNLRDLNVKWLRQQIGVVSQEPVLFNMSIRENLLMGAQSIVSDDSIVNACKKANCHGFISKLPQGYDTVIGDQGGMLSGGQKQRIAIARAVLKNPKILLLDEATSALDTLSERLVQSALDKASKNRTTIVIAHRLSTIMNADMIVVLDHGEIVEQGTHQELIDLQGVYTNLVKKQQVYTDVYRSKTGTLNNEYVFQQYIMGDHLQVIDKLAKDNTTCLSTANNSNSLMDERIQIDPLPKFTQNTINLHITNGEKHLAPSPQKAPIKKVFYHMRSEWNYLAMGLFGSALAGCIFPLYAYSFSHVISFLSLPNQNIQPSPLGGTNLYAFIFAIIGIVAFIGNGLQFMAFEVCGQKYSKRLRGQVFAAYLKQEVAFFDQEENNTGSLTTKLAVDSRNVNEMITKVWGDITNLIITIAVGLVIAFVHSWALSLITLCLSPFLFAATAYEFYLQRGFEDGTKVANIQSGQVAGEAIREVKTVTALNKQSYFKDRYYQATQYPHKLAMRKAFLSSIGAACSKGISIYTNALAFYAGTRLIINGHIGFQEMFTSMTVIMTTAEAAGRSTTFAATFSKAKSAAISCFEILERKPRINSELEGYEPNTNAIKGHVDYQGIHFAYPARPDVTIFDGEFKLNVNAGQTIALVGPSGCGKSTTIGMLQRWYDPLSGSVSLDHQNVKSYSLNNLRNHMALVGQEPILFDMTIGENIRFGVEETKQVSQQEIEDACKAANIHEFIAGLPEGYDTRVGDKGSQLSGGQKQRIAIARALIRKPRVLLLDEATSALDSDSERLVQEALDNILEEGGRTTITIAHRLSTIQNADLICVVKDGRVIEQGTHQELIQLNGTYKEMVHQQSLHII